MNNLSEIEKRSVYESMSIFEVRNYARSVGVKSATSKRKSELIDLILKIESGELEPYNNFCGGKGRPPKASLNYEVNLTEKQLEIEYKKLKSMFNRICNIIEEYKK